MSNEATNRRLFMASFLSLIAAGMGFIIRNAMLGVWKVQFDFNNTQVGYITGAGLIGFCVAIIACSLLADRIGYKPMMMLAFILHALSAVVTIAAATAFAEYGNSGAYWCLYIGQFMYAIANGLCEAVINPLTATLYPEKKTHYLNILHAGWPGGLIIGGIIAHLYVGPDAALTTLPWEIPICLFLLPTLGYGAMIFKEKFPHSEARAAGIELGTMLKQFAAPVFLVLLVLQAMVGYVELGTDTWIVNIMNNVIPGNAILLFIYTSSIMFVLRFFAGPIVERINPIGLLFISACLGASGLFALGTVNTGIAIIVAATVYALGKTFLWPTMLGVVGERFPKGGAMTMGAMGGIGMLSAGFLAGPGIGYEQDLYATRKLKETTSPEVFKEFNSKKKDNGLDAAKVGGIKKKLKNGEKATADEQFVLDAEIFGGRMALQWTALVPVMMAIGYLGLLLYFRSKGGYKTEILHDASAPGEEYTGGAEGPAEY